MKQDSFFYICLLIYCLYDDSKKRKLSKEKDNPIKKYSFLFMVYLIFEVFWAQRHRGYHLFEMHIVQFNMHLGTLVSTQAQTKKQREAERKCKMEFCNIQFTNGVIKKTQSSPHPQHSSVHTHKYRGKSLHWCLFSDGKERTGEKECTGTAVN